MHAPPPGRRLSLGEGDTPAEDVPAIAAQLGLARLVLKREDRNPTGSHKDRGAAYQVSLLASADPPPRWLVISSSGNAAIATARYGRAAGIPVAAFVSPRTSPAKRARITAEGALLLVSERALTLARDVAAARGLHNLRPSTDPAAPEGFQTLGWELLAIEPPVEAVFTFVSSATSLVAIGRAWQRPEFAAMVRSAANRPEHAPTFAIPQLHAVQGAGAQPVAGEFDKRVLEPAQRQSRVGQLGARKTRRVGEAKRFLRSTGGSGWVITDAEAEAAGRLLLDAGIDSSLEGAAALAAAGRAARERGLRNVAVVITGARRVDVPRRAGDSQDESHDHARAIDQVQGMAELSERFVEDVDAALQAMDAWPQASQDSSVPSFGSGDERNEPGAEPSDAGVVRNVASFSAWASRQVAGLSFVGPDTHYGIGLESLLPSMRFAVLDDTPAGRLLRSAGHAVLALEADPPPSADPEAAPLAAPNATAAASPAARDGTHPPNASTPSPPSPSTSSGSNSPPATRRPAGRNALDVLQAPATEAFLAEAPAPAILVFKSSHAIERRCRDMGWPLIASPAKLARRWENKLAFLEIGAELGLPLPPSAAVELATSSYAQLSSLLGPRLVVQGPSGYAGLKTFPVDDEPLFVSARDALRGRTARVSRRLEGETWTVNACVTARGVVVGAPFLQITGHPALTLQSLGSCGQDWSATRQQALDTAPGIELARRIGTGLGAEGYRGFFGVDLLRDVDGAYWVIEVNPRLVASVSAYTQLELFAGRLPMLARHVVSLRDPDADGASLDAHEMPLVGAQLVLHHVGSGRARTPRLASGWYGPVVDGHGAYACEQAGFRLDEPSPPATAPWLVLAPQSGRTLRPGDAWCRVQSRTGVTENGALRTDALAIVAWLQAQLKA